MQTEDEELVVERAYLQKVTGTVRALLRDQQEQAVLEKRQLVEMNRRMNENSVNFSHDFARMVEANQELGDIETRTINYRMLMKRLRLYERMVKAPYFARVDFTEDGFDREPIYIGVGSLTDESGLDAYVYDWRAPVASLFYRCEPGRAAYRSPMGEICGDINLKRQYAIENGELRYFFDCSVNVMDEVLRVALAKNASPKMKSIVETIQREQDVIIRDHESDLLMVQGAAGSGKTSVALHRVAFLMYEGAAGGLSAENILILSPNALFGRYISGVLPELGEENIATKTFEEIFEDYFGGQIEISSRASALEQIVSERDAAKAGRLKLAFELPLSAGFCEMLDHMVEHYQREILEIPELSYAGRSLGERQAVRAELLQARANMPLAKRLRVIEEKLLAEVHRQKKGRLAELEKFVLEHPEHQFEVKVRARLLSIKETAILAHKIRAFTRVSAVSVYQRLLADEALFRRLAAQAGLALPEQTGELLAALNGGLTESAVSYANGMALLYLHVRLTGARPTGAVRQVVVDEAQDYYPVHYRLLRAMLPNARYTVLGDVNQTIVKKTDLSFYDEVRDTLGKRKNTLATMNKSFRCSAEIGAFSRRFLENDTRQETFDRREEEPVLRAAAAEEALDELLLGDLAACAAQGFGSAAVLCKSAAEAQALYKRVGVRAGLSLVGEATAEIGAGAYIMPIYMAKGLEFDAAFVYGVSGNRYSTQDDRKLLYVACTRPLHRLYLYHTGEISPLIVP